MLKPTTQNILQCLKMYDIEVSKILSLINFDGVRGDLHNDSRLIVDGDIFCAIIGHAQDGRQYIEKAIEQGAKLVLTECESQYEHGEAFIFGKDTAVVKFYQLNQHLFTLAKAYYQAPQNNMTIVGITGTNGKTTTSQLLAKMLNTAQKPCAVIGTNGAGSIDNLHPIENTTPGACELHQLLYRFDRFNTADAQQENFSYVAMEVSSHALSQKRVQADLFDIALFTNLTRDHLDYHGSMGNYAQAKKEIFTGDSKQVSVINIDDERGKQWLENWPEQQAVWLYGRTIKVEELSTSQCFVTAKEISRHEYGVTFTLRSHLGGVEITSPLLGDFNIDNLLAAICVLLIEQVPLSEIPNLVNSISASAGRMEATSALDLATAVVDYAHTPDALDKALQACRQHCQGDLYVVFGCGGDRDKGKRVLMAQVAETQADFIVVTNDNPRSEDEQLIADDILSGFAHPKADKITVTLPREQAVLNTLKKAKAGDIILLAGKGHEDYIVVAKYDEQGEVIGTQKVAYNEREVVRNFYQQAVSVSISDHSSHNKNSNPSNESTTSENEAKV